MSFGRMFGKLDGDAESVARLERLARLHRRGRYFGAENANVGGVGASEAPTAAKLRISSSDVGSGFALLAGSAESSQRARWVRRALPPLVWAVVAGAAVFWLGRNAPQPAPQAPGQSAAEDGGRSGGGGRRVEWPASGAASAVTRTEPSFATSLATRDSAPGVMRSAERFDASSDIRRLIGQERRALAECQAGGSASACQLDLRLTHRLFSQGWCWGPPGQPEYEKAWSPCPTGATSPGRVPASGGDSPSEAARVVLR